MRPFWSLLFSLLALPALAADDTRNNLTVLADDALLQPLAQISRAYTSHANTPVTVVAKKSDTVQRQIEEGLEAHLLVTANTTLLSTLSERGLTDVTSRRTVARTGLALVTTNERAKTLGLAKHISFASVIGTSGNTPILTSEASTLEGERAFALTRNQPFSGDLQKRLTTRANEDEVLAALRDENALGLLLATQAIGQPDITVVSVLPDEISPAVNFDAVVLGGELTGEASAFIDYLGSAPAKKIFTRFGYQTTP